MCVCVCMHVHVCIYVCVHVCMCMYACMHICVCVCACVHVCVYACMYIYMSFHTHMSTLYKPKATRTSAGWYTNIFIVDNIKWIPVWLSEYNQHTITLLSGIALLLQTASYKNQNQNRKRNEMKGRNTEKNTESATPSLLRPQFKSPHLTRCFVHRIGGVRKYSNLSYYLFSN